METYRDILRKLTIRDRSYIQSALKGGDDGVGRPAIDARTHALVCIGALIAADAGTPSFMDSCEAALAAHATHEEIVGTLLAVLPVVGVARVVAAAPNLGLALGYDVAEALEAREPAAE